jgi:hypothetical protein
LRKQLEISLETTHFDDSVVEYLVEGGSEGDVVPDGACEYVWFLFNVGYLAIYPELPRVVRNLLETTG